MSDVRRGAEADDCRRGGDESATVRAQRNTHEVRVGWGRQISMRLRRAVLSLSVASFMARLSAAPEPNPVPVSLGEIVPDYMEGDLETAIVPRPQVAALGDSAFPVDKVTVVVPDVYKAPDTLVTEIRLLLGPQRVTVVKASEYDDLHLSEGTAVFVGLLRGLADWDFLGMAEKLSFSIGLALRHGPEAYLVYSRARLLNNMNVVFLTGATPAADFWALTALRQMIFHKDGKPYVREGRIVDFPRFAYRGNKQPRAWEWRYKANYGCEFVPPARSVHPTRYSNFRWDYFQEHGAWTHDASPLRATDAEMDMLMTGLEITDAEGKTRLILGAALYFARGCREFVLNFKDADGSLSDTSRKEFFKGDEEQAYYAALHHFLTGMHARIKALNPDNRVYFMPRPCSYSDF